MDLNAYGESGSEDDGEDKDSEPGLDESVHALATQKVATSHTDRAEPPASSAEQSDEKLKEARRERMREWIANRRAKQTIS